MHAEVSKPGSKLIMLFMFKWSSWRIGSTFIVYLLA
jgi:hypothetical protein